MSLGDPAPWLLLVAAAHLGFQLTVDLVVYPALGEVPADGWATAHDRHSRRIVGLVAALYPPLVVVLGWALVAEPRSVGTWVALAGGLLAVGTTAAVAAPTHGRLASAPAADRGDLMRRLDRADRLRSIGAVVCAVGAVWLVATA
ncbi:hypothetical protein SAMN05192575_1011022 [Nocardioides alpinus]|uniref:DUF1772 domain-containing protein n=1 Tax=Nocardioides alpinus TaxID=748909 RepID=A0A1I0WK11_9ACTN|nr:hypothetical protein [Nocardioides alpinus]PKH37946.1 hypothetical protein CXG46_21425 [Nocardioides alpinus]SFA88286.1 hypothetical protein SAMN05192575_1011022 [Nocardioides alpinus]